MGINNIELLIKFLSNKNISKQVENDNEIHNTLGKVNFLQLYKEFETQKANGNNFAKIYTDTQTIYFKEFFASSFDVQALGGKVKLGSPMKSLSIFEQNEEGTCIDIFYGANNGTLLEHQHEENLIGDGIYFDTKSWVDDNGNVTLLRDNQNVLC